MATLRERQPGVWEVRVFTGHDAKGRPTQLSRTVRGTKKEAQRVAATLAVQPRRNAGGRKLGHLLDEWIEVNQASWAPLTQRDQRSRAEQIKRDPLARMSVAAVGVSDIDRWVARLRGAGIGEASIRNQHTVLRAALQQAVRWEWISSNPAAAARIQQPKRQQRESMTTEDVKRVIEVAADVHPMALLALRLAAETGMRRNEHAALRWDKLVDNKLVIDGSVVVVKRADGTGVPTVQPTKTGGRRVVTLGASLAAAMHDAAEEWAHLTTWIFSPDADPPNPDRIGWWWRRTRELAGIDPKWRLHDLRHWSATHAIASGQDVRTVANRLGHADPSMTLRVYAHAVQAADEAVADLLGKALDR